MKVYKYTGLGSEAGVTSIIAADSIEEAQECLLKHPYFESNFKDVISYWNDDVLKFDTWEDYVKNGKDLRGQETHWEVLHEGDIKGLLYFEDTFWH